MTPSAYDELPLTHPTDNEEGAINEPSSRPANGHRRWGRVTMFTAIIALVAVAGLRWGKAPSKFMTMSPRKTIEEVVLPEVGCGIEHYDPKLVLPSEAAKVGVAPPLVVGTAANMATAGLPLDFTGVWWMKDNPVPEELLSFAGATVNSTMFPVQVQVPTDRIHMWSWDNSVPAHVIKAFYAFTTKSIDGRLHINFHNSTYGEIETGLTDLPLIEVKHWAFIKINEDQWRRPTVFQESSVFEDTEYTLTRVLRADGTPTLHYDEFQHWMMRDCSSSVTGSACGRTLTVFGSNNLCKRRCTLTWGSCWLCGILCGGKE